MYQFQTILQWKEMHIFYNISIYMINTKIVASSLYKI